MVPKTKYDVLKTNTKSKKILFRIRKKYSKNKLKYFNNEKRTKKYSEKHYLNVIKILSSIEDIRILFK